MGLMVAVASRGGEFVPMAFVLDMMVCKDGLICGVCVDRSTFIRDWAAIESRCECY